MLGGFMIVRRPGPEAGGADVDLQVLATWEASVGGLDWLEALERAGKTTCVSRNDYPHFATKSTFPL